MKPAWLLLAALSTLAALALVAQDAAAAPTWRIFATREGLVGGTTSDGHVIQPHDHFVALPSTKNLDCNGCTTYEVRVCNPANGRCVDAPQWDVGPWNTKDDYWNPSSVRQMWQDLPQGTPEAQAAYYDGYNGGKDQFGRTVRNPAGIDLADGTFWDDLAMSDNGWVDVTFLWMGGDSTPPSTPSLAETVCGPGWTTCDTPRWQWSASDPESGIAQYEVQPSWAGSFTTKATSWQPTLGTGTWSVRVRAEDGAGLWGAWSGWVQTRIDVTPPNAPSIGTAKNDAWSNDPAPVISWTDPGDAGSGVARYTRTLDGASANLGNALGDQPRLADGTHTYALRAVDGVGLASASSNALTLRIDTTPPVTSLDLAAPWADARGTWVGPATQLALRASDAMSGVARTEWRVDGGAWRGYAGPFALGGLADGPHTVGWRSADNAGNVEAEQRRALLLDATPPAVRIDQPAEGAIVVTTDTEQVGAPASDAGSGLAGEGLLVDDAPRPFAWRAGDEAAGNHTLVVLAVDHVGNVGLAVVNVTTVPTSVAGVQATVDRAEGLPAQPLPTVRLVVEADPAQGTARVGVEVDGRFSGVHVP